MPSFIDNRMVRKVASEHLESFKELPGFATAQLGAINPAYGPDGVIQAWEVEFRTEDGADLGYAMISATEDDMPVLEFCDSGPSLRRQLERRLSGERFRLVRFGPTYVTAEDENGDLLAEIGQAPVPLPREQMARRRSEGSDRRRPTRSTIAPRPALLDPRLDQPVPYAQLKREFDVPKSRPEYVAEAWAAVKSPHSPCTNEFRFAEGKADQPYFLQIPAGTPPNDTDHWSGCGATAWMNLYGWHDRSWSEELLAGEHTYNDAYVRDMTMSLHDWLGTGWMFGQGLTWPEAMSSGYTYARKKLDHTYSYWYRYDYPFNDAAWIFDVARGVVRDKRPFIVGYFQDWHYAIGYGTAECTKHGWAKHSWALIYPAWSADDSQNKWVPMSTIFGIWGVYEFGPNSLPSDFCDWPDAIVNWKNGKAYFFEGSKYVRWDIDNDGMDLGYPQSIDQFWPGLWADGIDAALEWDNDKVYFFKGDEYQRYDRGDGKVDPGYPQPIAQYWPGLWSSGIQAAINWGNGKAYFFRGDEYIRYDIGQGRADPGYPKPIAHHWPGLFTSSIDAALNFYNGKAYFFKGHDYVRWAVGEGRTDPGYPRKIKGNW